MALFALGNTGMFTCFLTLVELPSQERRHDSISLPSLLHVGNVGKVKLL